MFVPSDSIFRSELSGGLDPEPDPGMTPAYFVSVVIPHYRDLHNLDQCLRSLDAQTYPRAKFEVVVADNDSPEGRDAVTKVIAGRARLVVVDTRGAGAARNGGVAAALGSIIAFTDSDCRPEPSWLEEGVNALKGCDFVGGRMIVLVDDPARMTAEEAFERVFAFRNEDYVKRQGFTVSANLFCSRAVFETVGGFLPAGISEDRDWCYRGRDLGLRLGYADASVVGHPARRTWPQLVDKWRRINAGNFSLSARQTSGRLRWLLRTLLIPLSAFVHSPRVLLSRDIGTIRQRLGALMTLHRLRWWRFANSLSLLKS